MGRRLATPLSLDTGFLDTSYHPSKEDRAVPVSCLLASLQGQPQHVGFRPRSWCRFRSCRHRAAGPQGDFQQGLSRGSKGGSALGFLGLHHSEGESPQSELALASDLMAENMGNYGKFHRRLLRWTLSWGVEHLWYRQVISEINCILVTGIGVRPGLSFGSITEVTLIISHFIC